MSSIHDYSLSGEWDDYFASWLEYEPDIPDDLTDEEIDAMEEELQGKEFFRNHPSLSAQERNPNLK